MPIADARFELRIPLDLLRQIEEMRGAQPRAAFMKGLVEAEIRRRLRRKASQDARDSSLDTAPKL